MVPISNFVTRTPQQKVSSITRKDGLYAMAVRANAIAEKGFTKEQKVAELEQWLQSEQWPEDVRFPLPRR